MRPSWPPPMHPTRRILLSVGSLQVSLMLDLCEHDVEILEEKRTTAYLQ